MRTMLSASLFALSALAVSMSSPTHPSNSASMPEFRLASHQRAADSPVSRDDGEENAAVYGLGGLDGAVVFDYREPAATQSLDTRVSALSRAVAP